MITQKAIDRVLKFLIFAQNRVIKDKECKLSDLAREYRISAGVASLCYKLKYFDKVDSCTFCNVDTFEPFHARKILEYIQEYARKRNKEMVRYRTFDELINDLKVAKEQLEKLGNNVSIVITTKQEIVI